MTMRDCSRMIMLSGLAATILIAAAPPAGAGPVATGAATPAEMVATYRSLADAILAVKKTEASLVRSILGAAYAHAQVELERARKAIRANDAGASRATLENLAAIVAQIGSEGDSAVGAVRKRLLEGGHHHHASGEAKGLYDEGFVVVTRAARKAFLESSRALGQLAASPDAAALEAEWRKIKSTWAGIMKQAS